MNSFPAYKIKKEYDKLFSNDPLTANVFLLLYELADETGQVDFSAPRPEKEILHLLSARFDNVRGYQL